MQVSQKSFQVFKNERPVGVDIGITRQTWWTDFGSELEAGLFGRSS
jgi:hypothetical protein